MTARALISLAEANKRVAEQRAAAEFLRLHGTPNGIACPKCARELHDRDRGYVGLLNATGAPIQACHCPACGWKGAREC